MPLELLHRIADAPLPLRIGDPSDIDKLRALQAAGQVRADIPAPQRGLGGQEQQAPATVFEIRRLGLMALRSFRRPASGDAGPGDEPPAHADAMRSLWPGAAALLP